MLNYTAQCNGEEQYIVNQWNVLWTERKRSEAFGMNWGRIFKKGCPITQLYLAVGHYPARFEIQKIRLLYLKYILEEDDSSLLNKFFKLQFDFPTKGDWASTCMNDMKELNIHKSLEEIKLMSKNEFTQILKENCRKNAFK